MKEIECPYCEYDFDLCHDDGAYYNEEHREEIECPKCEKKFMVNSQMDWTFSGEKCDCLNGGEHKWEKKYNEKYYPQFKNKEICSGCDEERDLNPHTEIVG